jgi:hypothetical protein
MTGEFTFAAVSNTALTELVLTTFTAGNANPSSLACANSDIASGPLSTPNFMTFTP